MTKVRPEKKPDPVTVAMVSKAIKKAQDYPSRKALWENLPRRIAYGTFKKVIQYLIDENKIILDGGHIVWVFADNPKLVRLQKESTQSVPAMTSTKRGRANA